MTERLLSQTEARREAKRLNAVAKADALRWALNDPSLPWSLS